MSEELKPCPFCGSRPRLYEADGLDPDRKDWMVGCTRWHGCIAPYKMVATREGAIAAWNTRAADVPRSGVLVPSDKMAEMQAEIAALRAERDALRERNAAGSHQIRVMAEEQRKLRDQIAALPRESDAALSAPDEADVERVATLLATIFKDNRFTAAGIARAAITAFIAGRK